MAVVWAKNNGNWTTATLWAFWNETTQQIEDYGQVPQVGDVVYCNGYKVTGNIQLPNVLIRNDENPHTGISGGYVEIPNNTSYRYCAASFYAVSRILKTLLVNSTYTINGNVTAVFQNVTDYFYESSGNLSFVINGNVDITGGSFIYTPQVIGDNIIINGNYHHTNGYTIFLTQVSTQYIHYNTNVHNIIFNGEFVCETVSMFSNGLLRKADHIIFNGRFITPYGTLIMKPDILADISSSVTFNADGVVNMSIIGSLNAFNGLSYVEVNKPIVFDNEGYITCGELIVSSDGTISYNNINNIIGTTGINANKITINNPDTFTWKDISEPRVNPFIIVTDAEMNNRQQYPSEDEVKEGTEYVWGQKVGTYTPDYPPESVVLDGFEYGDNDDRKTGTMTQEVNVQVGCVTREDVRENVPLVGMGVVGSLVVPSVDDVREGVVFDNGSVGTLIVQGGGDRLRIADFGYYTNAQSDTYIVDLTEQDKPKFAVAEERVLIEMFPDLDLDNIPEKYFDDLFVKYLKYRLIVEYYRTAGINSTFTPSEPTTEIVNYQNVRNEVWLNSANIYLKAWSKKYPESITKPQRILL